MAKQKNYDNWKIQNKIDFFKSREKENITGLSLLSAFFISFENKNS